MKISKIMLITLITGILAVPLVSCNSGPETVTENQAVMVQRGNLIIDITASGNLALSRKEDIAFEISGTTQEPMTVEEVLVEAGDAVREGQVVARLDTTSLEKAIKTAEQAVRTAEIDLETATDSYRKLTYPYDYRTFTFDVPAAIALNNNTRRELDEALEIMRELGLSREQYSWEQYWDVFTRIQQALDDMAKVRDNLTRGYGQGVFETGILPMGDFWTLRAAQLNMDKIQVALDKTMDTLDEVKDKLEKAVVIAPFDGFITLVNVEGGDEIKKGTVAVQIADPDKFEAEVMVSEMDILQLKLGAAATVQVDAMSMVSLPAKVTHISPTATIQSGVVNYKVKVEIQSLEAAIQEQQKSKQEAMRGELPERIRLAIEEGRITQEQAEEMMKQRQQEQGGRQAQMPTMLPEDFQLREGLTVTVSIQVEGKDNVLLVPNSAITRQGGETLVQVLKDGFAEQRSIKTGISNWQYTEVTDGLNEGEKVIVPQGATTTPTTQQGQRAPGFRMPFAGGGGGGH